MVKEVVLVIIGSCITTRQGNRSPRAVNPKWLTPHLTEQYASSTIRLQSNPARSGAGELACSQRPCSDVVY
jgi:hypothetical protein